MRSSVRDSGIPSVWDVVPDDGDLYREVFQEHFSSTNLQVIAVFKARSPTVGRLGSHE